MNKKLDVANDNINKLLLAFSIPCVISMLINAFYNIIDQIFIGKGVGTIGNAATNVIFPIVIICNAIASLIGNGCAANLSLKLGEGKNEEASKSVGSSITLLFIFSIVLAILGELFLPKLIYLDVRLRFMIRRLVMVELFYMVHLSLLFIQAYLLLLERTMIQNIL